jgi:single-strand DNA-binding protein
LGRDPEIKYTPSGVALAKFSMATDETFKDAEGNTQSQTEWHNVVVWRRQAEVAGEYLKKGTLIYLEGRLRTRSWDDPQGGGKKYRTEVQGDRFVMLSGRDESAENTRPSPPPAGASAAPAPPLEEDEDLPF